MDSTGIIFDIKKYSINDGPGIRTTVFFQGCPLICDWCHNPESQARTPVLIYRSNRCALCGDCASVCPNQGIHLNGQALTERSKCSVCGTCAQVCYRGAREISGYQTNVNLVMNQIQRDIPFFDQSGGGVTFSGGEPLLQHQFLSDLLQACRDRDIHTAVDTSGFAPWQVMDKIRRNVDLFLFDLKIMDDAKHKKYTGVSNQVILKNLQLLSQLGHSICVRVPIIPGLNDDEENLQRTGAFLQDLEGVVSVDLMKYHSIADAKYEALGMEYKLRGQQSPSSKTTSHWASVLEDYGVKVKVE